MENLIKGFKENKAFRITSLLVLLLILITVLAPVIAPYNPLEAVMRDANAAPSAAHLFGTDKLGRDVLSRILYGASYSLTSVLFLVFLIFVVGTFLGVIAGYFGGIVDTVIMRFADMMISFPGVILAIAIAGILGGSLVNAMIAMLCVTWTKYARENQETRFRGCRYCKRRFFCPYSLGSYSSQYPASHGHHCGGRYRCYDDGIGGIVFPWVRQPASGAGVGSYAE